MATPGGWDLDHAETFVQAIIQTIGRGLTNREALTAVRAFDTVMNINHPFGWLDLPAPPRWFIFSAAMKEWWYLMNE